MLYTLIFAKLKFRVKFELTESSSRRRRGIRYLVKRRER